MSPAKYEFEGVAVRVLDQAQQPWFVLADVAKVLGIANPRDTAMGFAEDEKGVATTDTPGGPQRLTIISEPGLYRMIFKSRKPSAGRFKSWVVREVLPAIRKTGQYGGGDVEAATIKGLLVDGARRLMAGSLAKEDAKMLIGMASRWLEVHRLTGRATGGRAVLGNVSDEDRAGELLTMIDSAWFRGQRIFGVYGMWSGQARELQVRLEESEDGARIKRLLAGHRIERLLGILARRAPQRVTHYRTKRARYWRISQPQDSA
jgi:prophage antirepressor-like protein